MCLKYFWISQNLYWKTFSTEGIPCCNIWKCIFRLDTNFRIRADLIFSIDCALSKFETADRSLLHSCWNIGDLELEQSNISLLVSGQSAGMEVAECYINVSPSNIFLNCGPMQLTISCKFSNIEIEKINLLLPGQRKLYHVDCKPSGLKTLLDGMKPNKLSPGLLLPLHQLTDCLRQFVRGSLWHDIVILTLFDWMKTNSSGQRLQQFQTIYDPVHHISCNQGNLFTFVGKGTICLLFACMWTSLILLLIAWNLASSFEKTKYNLFAFLES